MELTEALKKIRKQYKMTQEDVAKFLGISRSGYTYYETGKSLPSIEVLKKLAAIYDTTIDVVVGIAQKTPIEKSKAEAAMENGVDPLVYMKKDEKELLMAYRICDAETKERLKEIAMKMLDKNGDS